MFLSHVDKEMKDYVKSKTCRRDFLLSFFDCISESNITTLHLCCDNCALECECGSDDCRYACILKYPMVCEASCPPSKTRLVSTAARTKVKEKLIMYHKEILDKLTNSIHEKVITPPKFLLGFSQLQISQVVQHCTEMFSVADICQYVEIWDKRHAWKIYNVLNEVFGDTCPFSRRYQIWG